MLDPSDDEESEQDIAEIARRGLHRLHPAISDYNSSEDTTSDSGIDDPEEKPICDPDDDDGFDEPEEYVEEFVEASDKLGDLPRRQH